MYVAKSREPGVLVLREDSDIKAVYDLPRSARGAYQPRWGVAETLTEHDLGGRKMRRCKPVE